MSSIGALKRIAWLAVGAGVAATLATAAPSYAASCQPDGRINGGGATFSNNAFRQVFVPGYTRDVCGYLPTAGATDANNEPNSGRKMVWYNWAGRPTGSGSGIDGARCRLDAFEGTDVPFTIAQLQQLRGAVPSANEAPCLALQGLNQQFLPGPAPFPGPNDTQANLMAFPVLGGAVGVGVNLTAAACGGATPPSVIQLNSLQASRLFGGDIATWNDAALVAIQPTGSTLANCNTPVTRIARSDNSGTTTIFKNYLARADGARALCEDGTTWQTFIGQNGNNLPEGPNCSAFEYVQGNPAVIDRVAAVVGAVGYGDLSDWRLRQPQLTLATIRNQSNSAYVSPVNGSASNCSFQGAVSPPGGANGAVNMAGNAWASDATPAASNATYVGSGYPICGYSFAMVRPGLGSGSTAVARLNQNQRDTIQSFFLYVLSPTTQAQLSTAYYAPVPSDLLSTIRTGFNSNYPVTATP